jgi:hypothetical protein
MNMTYVEYLEFISHFYDQMIEDARKEQNQ